MSGINKVLLGVFAVLLMVTVGEITYFFIIQPRQTPKLISTNVLTKKPTLTTIPTKTKKQDQVIYNRTSRWGNQEIITSFYEGTITSISGKAINYKNYKVKDTTITISLTIGLRGKNNLLYNLQYTPQELSKISYDFSKLKVGDQVKITETYDHTKPTSEQIIKLDIVKL